MCLPKKASVELMARVGMLVPSFGTSVSSSNSNAAVTCMSALAVTGHVGAAPVHAPPQPRNRAAAAGNAVSVVVLVGATLASQTAEGGSPQSMLPPCTWPGPVTATEMWISAGG